MTALIKAVKAVVIMSRNLDNIPFIASCQVVTSSVVAASRILSHLSEGTKPSEGLTCVVLVCLLLEALYDPYFTYRKFLVNQSVDLSKMKYQPALLHVEVIPFIYGIINQADCWTFY